LQITCYSIITTVFKDELIRYITYIEIVAGLGLSLGPAVGSFVYGTLDFKFRNTMIFFAALNFIGMVLCIILMPSKLNKTIKED
jgi:MFS family permease